MTDYTYDLYDFEITGMDIVGASYYDLDFDQILNTYWV